jgi:hypothetical protein
VQNEPIIQIFFVILHRFTNIPLYFIVVFADIFKTGELQPDATVAKFAIVVNRGIRVEVTEAESSVF